MYRDTKVYKECILLNLKQSNNPMRECKITDFGQKAVGKTEPGAKAEFKALFSRFCYGLPTMINASPAVPRKTHSSRCSYNPHFSKRGK